MRRIRTIPLLLGLCLTAGAQAQDHPQLEVRAAAADARNDLRSQLLEVYLAPGVRMADVIQDVPTVNLDAILAKADTVGQPRWVGQDIVQVKLHLMARDLVNAIQGVRQSLIKRVSESDFNRFKKEWINRSFQATGQAIPAGRIRQVVTTLQPIAWAAVPPDARADVASRAKANASSKILAQTYAIRFGPNETVENQLAGERGKTNLVTWADALPATRILLRDDRQMDIGVYVDRPGLADVLKSSLLPNATAESAQALAKGVGGLPEVVTGSALLVAMPATAPQSNLVIHQAPPWASDPITAQGEAKFSTTQLRTARAAERTAREALRDKLQTLTIDNGVPLAQAQPHAAVQAAIGEAVERARVAQVDYRPDGSALVTISLDPNDLLDALTGQ
ncbi:MAG: hypothetical protein ACTHLN_05140 [Tepidisphaeraceae bacterium]